MCCPGGMWGGRKKTDASRARKLVPWEALLKSSRMTQIMKKEMVNNTHDHFACITPKGKNRLQVLRDILCEQMLQSASGFITILLVGGGEGTEAKEEEKTQNKNTRLIQRLSFWVFFPFSLSGNSRKQQDDNNSKEGKGTNSKGNSNNHNGLPTTYKRITDKIEKSQEKKTSIMLLEEN